MLRLQVAYALEGGAKDIRPEHVVAALAAWLYAQDSARTVFGTAAGDPDEDRLLSALIAAGDAGLDFEAQRDLFHRNLPAKRLPELRAELERRGLIETTSDPTDGRPRSVSRYVGTTETTKDPLRAILDEVWSSPSFPSSGATATGDRP